MAIPEMVVVSSTRSILSSAGELDDHGEPSRPLLPCPGAPFPGDGVAVPSRDWAMPPTAESPTSGGGGIEARMNKSIVCGFADIASVWPSQVPSAAV